MLKEKKGETYEVCSVGQSRYFAPGFKSVLEMLAGGYREDVISVGLEDGMALNAYVQKVQEAIRKIWTG